MITDKLPRARRACLSFASSVLRIIAVVALANTAAITVEAQAPAACTSRPIAASDGPRKLALLVGVADYASRRVPDLDGPVNDVRHMQAMLTGPGGYGFAPDDVCVLLDEQATTAAFKSAFQSALIDRAREGDSVVIFFAGHGSQTRDTGGDESDGWDETLLLQDARTRGVRDLRDDELFALLTRLHAKTSDITLIVDACSSGTAMRTGSGQRARFVPPQATTAPQPQPRDANAPHPEALPLNGLASLAAARDGTAAIERDGRGVFTRALIDALGSAPQALNYADIARLVPLRIAPISRQIPVFKGALERQAFSSDTTLAKRQIPSPVSPLTISVRGAPPTDQLASRRRALIDALATALPGNAALVDTGGDLEVEITANNGTLIRGPDNVIRNALTTTEEIIASLQQHARAHAVLNTRSQDERFDDQDSLHLRLLPAASQPACAQGSWQQAAANAEQIIPLCHDWQIEVGLAAQAPTALEVSATVVSADGHVFTVPKDEKWIVLQPGQRHVFAEDATFRGQPPLGVHDRVMAFGRDADVLAGQIATVSAIDIRVEANSHLSERSSGPFQPREYTLAKFDIRPYLPADEQAPLRRVLELAHQMTATAGRDGLPYRQHSWDKDSDAANLAVGIDCSRAIWYAFTRAGLPYNRDDRYLHTAAMLGDDTAMHDQFDSCPANEPYRLGDVLVYRSDERGDGHTVMVIDEARRISWGSMGWDGNPQDSDNRIAPDTGVEYQRIKYKPDWERWDRRDMTLRACWRYRGFESADDTPRASALPPNPCAGDRCALPTRQENH